MSGRFLNSREYQEHRQRERLRVALVRAMADGDHGAITVARVSELSGCSPEVFHHHYEDLMACYRDACSHSLQESRSATIDAWLTVRGWSERLRQACHALLAHVEEHPDAARAVLCGSIAGGPDEVAHVRELTAFHERVLVMGFQLHPRGFPTSRLTPQALTGGMRHVVYLRLRQGREHEIARLAEDLHDWIECHRSSAAARLPVESQSPARAVAVAGAPAREEAREEAREGERGRVLRTVAQLMLQSGRERLDDATIARFAGISAARFSSEYGGVAACATELVDELLDGNAAALRAGLGQGHAWPASVRLALTRSMGHLRANLELARLCVLRLPTVPALAGARHAALADRIVSTATSAAPAPVHARALMSDALVGVVDELLAWALSGDAPARSLRRLSALADQISFFLLAPYLGGEAAAEAVTTAATDADGRAPLPEGG